MDLLSSYRFSNNSKVKNNFDEGPDEQAILMFQVLKRHFTFERIKEITEKSVKSEYKRFYGGFTIVHYAVSGGLFRLFEEVFLGEYGFNVDFYLEEEGRVTLLQAVARNFSDHLWKAHEQEAIKKLVMASNYVFMKDSDGKTLL